MGPTQYKQALAHIAQVIRQDDGSGQLAADRLDGLSYAVILQGDRSSDHQRHPAAGCRSGWMCRRPPIRRL